MSPQEIVPQSQEIVLQSESLKVSVVFQPDASISREQSAALVDFLNLAIDQQREMINALLLHGSSCDIVVIHHESFGGGVALTAIASDRLNQQKLEDMLSKTISDAVQFVRRHVR